MTTMRVLAVVVAAAASVGSMSARGDARGPRLGSGPIAARGLTLPRGPIAARRALPAGRPLADRGAAAAQGPTFRSRTDLVPVYVSVRADDEAVTNLTTSDFQLTDRGVPQVLDAALSESVPIDVTLVVDASASVFTSLERFRADIKAIVAGLHPDERIRLIAFETTITQVLAMQAPSAAPPVREIRPGDRTSLVDALVIAMARARRPDRRHLLFVFTDGLDTSSALDYGILPELAGRMDGLLHVVLVPSTGALEPESVARMDALAAAAARTGGRVYSPGRNRDIVSAFNQAIEVFRHSYVLYFQPTGVEREGWHDVAVTLTRRGTYTVRAREGYFGQ